MSTKLYFVLIVVWYAFALARATDILNDKDLTLAESGLELELMPLSRRVRSPDGSVSIDYKKDEAGRTAGAEYQQNLYKGDNGRLSVDAYGRAERDFDRNRNNFGGGVRTSWRF